MTASIKSNAKSRKATKGARRRVAAGKATTFDRSKYATLLSRALPMVITTKAEYDQTITEKPSKDEAFFWAEQLDIHLLAKVGYQWMLQGAPDRNPGPERESEAVYGRSSQPTRGRDHFSSA
jgi:hypothetical protein